MMVFESKNVNWADEDFP